MEKLLEKFGASPIERVEKALLTLQQGKGILLVDDENRENEGDIIFPASTITEKDMALLIRECSGLKRRSRIRSFCERSCDNH
jgi:3,4-dihydroxy 2-butanone 4-phosphate synthase